MPNFMSKGYDANQVIRSVYDINKNALRVNIEGSLTIGDGIEVVIDHANDSIRLGDGTNLTTTTTVGSDVGLDVNVINPITITDSDGDTLDITDNGGILTNNQDTTITILNVVAVAANTEYSVNIPANTKKLIIRSRSRGRVQFTNVAGQSNINYISLAPTAVYTDDNFYENLTIYFRTSKAGDVLEVLTYQ